MTAGWLPTLAALAFCNGSAAAQEREPASAGRKVEALMKRAVSAIGPLLSRPLHPIIGGVGPGGWPGVGLEYVLPTQRRWEAIADARITLQRYWSVQALAGYGSGSVKAEAYARAREMTKLDFFGLGSGSDDAMRSTYRQGDRSVGALASMRTSSWLSVGARAEMLWFSIGRGHSSAVPDIHQLFSPDEVPGLLMQPAFGRYGVLLDFALPRAPGEGFFQGAKYRLTSDIFDDRELGLFSFRRSEIEVQHRFALLGPHRRLTLHGWLSVAEPREGNDVPFYLQRTLGGKSSVGSMREEMIGSDDSRATLRGFRDLRFRGRDLMLLQAEYRIPLWGPVDATVFGDWGQVAMRRADLHLSEMHRDFGLSLSVMKGPASVVRVDLGGGGGEGYRVFFTVGRDIVP